MDNKDISRREFIKRMGAGAATIAIASTGCNISDPKPRNFETSKSSKSPQQMTYRINPSTGDNVSILGYGCMRLPIVQGNSEEKIDQDMCNKLVDYALEHGVNLFDTSPAYCKGQSEHAMGIALSRHKRNSYFISTKLSNFAPQTWSREASLAMYKNSLKELQTDYLDYMLLHAIGLPASDEKGNFLSSEEAFQKRYIENGVLDFLVEERKAGRIRNLGFSYHGDVKIFDNLLSLNDKYHWNFVLIQLNYVDWKHAKQIDQSNTNAEYLQQQLDALNIPSLVMEPLLGGRLADLPEFLSLKLKQRRPEESIASWAFRFAGSPKGVLSVLSGMTYMEHLKDNVLTYSPLEPVSPDEAVLLEDVAQKIAEFPAVNCTNCQYCMPCPYGLNIPAIFKHYNKCINEGYLVTSVNDENYKQARRAFLIGYDRSVHKLRQADHCTGCGICRPHCPQTIDIPAEMVKINTYVEKLKREQF